MNLSPNLQAIHLSCCRQQKLLFQPISFTLAPKEILLIQGENGIGKSSLLRLLTGLSTASVGDLFWNHQPIATGTLNNYSQQFHYLGHHNGIKTGLSVKENLNLSQHLALAANAELETCLTLLNLQQHANTKAAHLSAGQQRRLALAKLFILPKPLWILDEPLTALDQASQKIILQALKKHSEQGGMSIITSHHSLSLDVSNLKTLRLSAC
jgi:heme exporter protein A